MPAGVKVQPADPELEGELAENKKELAKLRAEVERLKAEAKRLKAEAEKQKAEAEKQRAEVERQKAEAEKQRAEVARQKAEAEKQRAEVERQRAEAEKLKAEAQKLRTENIQKETENAQKTAEIARLAQENANLDAELKVLKREAARCQEEISSLKAEMAKLKSEVSQSTTELQAENSLLRDANQNLRRELLDTMERCARLLNRLKRLEQSAAGVLERMMPVYAGVREVELAEALELTMSCGMQLVAKSTTVCEMLYPMIAKLNLSDVEKAKLRVALDALSTLNKSFARLSVPSVLPEQFRKCRVLEISEEPEAIILNAGYRDGVRVNMKLQTGTGEKTCVLRIVAVRPFVSAAVVVNGSSSDLGVGQEVQAVEDKK